MLYFGYARIKNCAESLIFVEGVLPAFVLSKRDGPFRYQSSRWRDQCIPQKVHLLMMDILNATLMPLISMRSALRPIEHISRDQAGLIAPLASRTLRSEATGHRLPGE